MVTFLCIIILLLIGIICFQYQFNRTRSKNLKYIQRRLNEIISNPTNEKLLLFTDDKDLISILVEVNHLLDVHQKALAQYMNTETSMKRMLSNISHDLKTPLTVILGYMEMIQLDSNMSHEERTVFQSKVYNKTTEVKELIHKFFDLAKLESGDNDISITSVHMNEICRKNILEYYDVLTVKGFSVQIDIPDRPIHALGNVEALDRILNNLISNAIQYGGDGKMIGITLRNDNEFVHVDVWDKGKGIKEHHKNQVFERLYTLEDSRNKSYQGSGLGLTITKRLVEKMGGTILLFSSKPWEKTVFSFTLKRINY
ncbi:sensor histidine kinase [Cytobacillus dafuensis]|uniref:histidine kinase n=1 Tax=Cytobacillus dafuensis TaxID=1742359 RepID=A0A5B8Z8P9_CYTDA|nr:sensor histidine kinase [Cytobacillus dafuensis]QED49328.1 HAMP domain-containing histidine kinase [Cytobacillus dafuensis]